MAHTVQDSTKWILCSAKVDAPDLEDRREFGEELSDEDSKYDKARGNVNLLREHSP
ncbi:hypothetical protein M413DRAFT_449609 [Hebeloma cylindrosporum]|uniref:Uncharacterized protein n=1 Tax=Hebeloma cylindrosporum TaxID=76867 RepID=A0A0C2XD21_HEBCY|nr:hypothetical protein M413DRAFT_449609 [Hebeloma cylindrosporum h7]